MAQKSEENSTEIEKDEIGMFLMNVFHKGCFQPQLFIEKRLLRNEILAYAASKKLSWNISKTEALLNKYKFMYHRRNTTTFKIDGKTFWDFRRNVISKLDEMQIKKNFSTITGLSNEGTSNNIDNIEVDPMLPVYDLEFKQSMVKTNNRNIAISSKGCFICQLNFTSESDYDDHIKLHGSLSDNNGMKSDLKNFEDIVIDKIVIVQSNAMIYLLEETVPVSLSKSAEVKFLVDCHLFEVGYEYPIFILYKLKNKETMRMIEEHQFLRLEPFPLIWNIKLKSKRIMSRGILQFKRNIPYYLPSAQTEALCNKRDLSEEHIKDYNAVMRNYLMNNRSLSQSNFVDVFTLLLEIEDIAIRQECFRLNQKDQKINGFGKDYSVKLNNVNNISVQDILSEGDKIILFEEIKKKNGRMDKIVTPAKKKKYYGRVDRICGSTIYFSLKRPVATSEKYDIKFEPNQFQIMAQRNALNIFHTKPFLSKILFPVVTCNQSPAIKRLPLFNTSLYDNPEQEEAVRNILAPAVENIPYVIFGPPGTGKTATIVECILQIWKHIENSRILIVAGSNAACDEVALRLLKGILKLDPDVENVIRVYAAAAEKRTDSLDVNLIEASNLCHGYHFYPSIETICTYRIVVCTLTVSGKLYQGNMDENFFSHIFVDECAASTETEVLIPICSMMSHKCKLILSGDSKQLGPLLNSKLANDLGLKTSLLERLLDRGCYQKSHILGKYNNNILTRLVRNFRSHPDILRMSNHLYYENELIACANKDLTHWAIGWHLLPQKNVPIIFHAVRGRSVKEGKSTSLCNYAEINIVMDYVKDLMFFGVNGRTIKECDIGIVTPYKKQYNLIRAQLDQRKWFNIETGSVEIFQGKEKPIIIFSTVRSETKTLGFLDNPKRLNVSLTRAQGLLIIIGNPQTLSISDDWKYVVEYCTEKGVVCGAISLCATSSGMNCNSLNSSVSDISSITNSLNNISVKKEGARPNHRKTRRRNQYKQVKTNNLPNVKEVNHLQNVDEWLSNQRKTSDTGLVKNTQKIEAPATTASQTNKNELSYQRPMPVNYGPHGVVAPYSINTDPNIRNKQELNSIPKLGQSQTSTLRESPNKGYYQTHPYRLITESNAWQNVINTDIPVERPISYSSPNTQNFSVARVPVTQNVIRNSEHVFTNITPERKEKSKSRCSVS